MFDSSSEMHKLSVAVSTFKQLLGDSRIDNVPILVVANKQVTLTNFFEFQITIFMNTINIYINFYQDAPNALRPDEIAKALDLISISPSKHKIEVIGCQTRPLPDLPPGTKEYTYHHPSVDVVKKKIFVMATA